MDRQIGQAGGPVAGEPMERAAAGPAGAGAVCVGQAPARRMPAGAEICGRTLEARRGLDVALCLPGVSSGGQGQPASGL